MQAWIMLAGLAMVAAGGWMGSAWAAARRGRQLSELARRNGWRYAAEDGELEAAILSEFPVPGIAEVEVGDLIRGPGGVVCTVSYTAGVLGAKRRIRQVVRVGQGERPRLELAGLDEPVATAYQRLMG